MATVTYHRTEDNAATVAGSKHTVLVVDTGCVTEVLQRAKPATKYGIATHEWDTVKEFDGTRSYSAAIDFAELYVDGLRA